MSITGITLPLSPEQLVNAQQCGNIDSYILPHVILWDPLNQFPSSFPHGISCPTCSKLLDKITYWKWGQSTGLQPRVIHGLETTILIVPAICGNKHTLVSTDPRILNILKYEQLPFVLLHRTGFSKQFVLSIIQLLSEGMTISRVEQYIKKSICCQFILAP